jgi:hypothetical protein
MSHTHVQPLRLLYFFQFIPASMRSRGHHATEHFIEDKGAFLAALVFFAARQAPDIIRSRHVVVIDTHIRIF